MRIHQIYVHLEDYRRFMERLYRRAYEKPVDKYVFAYTLGATGRRMSEVLALTTDAIDFERGVATWRVLKKHDPGYYVTLPLSPRLADLLKRYIAFNAVSHVLFPVPRQTAWRWVKSVMHELGLYGWRPHDLRHAFILEALLNVKSIELVRRWVQHATYKQLLEYARVVGMEVDKPLTPW